VHINVCDHISTPLAQKELEEFPTVVMGHGSGGKMMSDLIQHLFAPLLKNDLLDQLGDSTVIDLARFSNGNQPSAISDWLSRPTPSS